MQNRLPAQGALQEGVTRRRRKGATILRNNQQELSSDWTNSPLPWILILSAASLFSCATAFSSRFRARVRRFRVINGGRTGPPRPPFSDRGRWGSHTPSRSDSATNSRHTSSARWHESRARNTCSNLTTWFPTMSALKDGLLEASPMQRAIASTAGGSVGRLIYRCWTIGDRLMSRLSTGVYLTADRGSANSHARVNLQDIEEVQ